MKQCRAWEHKQDTPLKPKTTQHLEIKRQTQKPQEIQSDFARYHAAQGRKEGEEAGFKAGKKAGLEAGKKAGLEDGQRAIVLRLLVKRFGPLDPAALAQVEKASVSTLELWADRLFSADTLDQILSDSGDAHQ